MEWIESPDFVPYPDAVSAMEERVDGIRAGTMEEAVWLLKHPPLYTAGTSAKAEDLLNPRFPVFQTGRGGQYTYHGPGQRVAYVMLDLKKRQSVPDIKKYVWQLEEWVICSLAAFDIRAERREGRVGLWVVNSTGGEDKIAAVGVRIRHWVTFHGIAINVNPDLSHFNGIVPCGIREHGVTSVSKINPSITIQDIDEQLKNNFDTVFPIGLLFDSVRI